MEKNDDGGKEKRMESSEEKKKGSNETNEDENNRSLTADTNISSNVDSNKKSAESAESESASAFKTMRNAEIEGEDQDAPKEPTVVGSTFRRYKYDRIKDEYDEAAMNLRNTAVKTMLRMLELQAAQRLNQPSTSKQYNQLPITIQRNVSVEGGMSSDGGATDIEIQIKDLERQLKSSVTRVAESRREQAHLMSLINNLEVQMYRTEEAECIKDMMEKVPDERDLEKMKRLQLVMLERKRLERQIERLQMEIRVMNNAMANADVIISESAPIKKPRRVVIQEETTENLNCKPEWRPAKALSPEEEVAEPAAASTPETEEPEAGRKLSAESYEENETQKEPSDFEAKTPPNTKGKKSKK